MTNQYDADYYLRGVQTGKSLYSDYRYLPNLTKTMVQRIADHLEIEMADDILDFGCARGYVVRAMVELGYNAYGVDVSEWAIANCDENVRGRVTLASPVDLVGHDWILSKDVMEHIPEEDIMAQLSRLAFAARKGVFLVVPLSAEIDQPYVVPDYEKDITHQIRWPMLAWMQAIETAFGVGWSFQFQYRLEGCKDNYAQWPKGNGFITVRKLSTARPD